MENLKQVQEYLDSIPYINSGGCAIAALAIYRWAEKKKVHNNYEFVYLFRSKNELEELYS